MFWGGSCHRKRFPAGDGGESIPFSISSVRKSRWDWKHVNVQSLDEGALSSQILTFFFPPLFLLLRTSCLHGLCHSHPYGHTPRLPLLCLLLFSGLPHPFTLPPGCFPELPHYLSLRSRPSAHYGWWSLQERARRDPDLSCIVAAWTDLGACLRDLLAPILEH